MMPIALMAVLGTLHPEHQMVASKYSHASCV